MSKRKGNALKTLIDAGLVRDGEVLRYKNKQGMVLAVGQAREGGIEVDGASKLLGYTAFEERSGSRYHRPAEHTHTSRGATLQGLMLGALAAEEAGGGGGWQPEREEGAAQQLPLLEDENDEFCHICGLEGDLLCCESCPATYHTGCVGLAAAPEGDWYCPHCTCDACGSGAGFSGAPVRGGGGRAGSAAVQWVSTAGCYVGPEALQPLGRPLVGSARLPGAEVAAAGTSGQDLMRIDGEPGGPGPGSTADFSGICAALAQAPLPAEPPAGAAAATAAGAADGAQLPSDADIRCAATGRRFHLGCLPAGVQQQLQQQGQQQQGQQQQPWFSSEAAGGISAKLAVLCARGVIPLGSAAAAAPSSAAASSSSSQAPPLAYSFQLVRGAAAAAPATCAGYAPAYSPEQRQQLQRALSAALHVLHSCLQPVPDSRTGADILAWLVRGAVLAEGAADYSGCHTALLYAGSTVAAVGILRVLGPALAELPVLAVRAELQQNHLGPLLLAAVERLLLELGVQAVVTPAFVAPGIPHVAFPEPPPQQQLEQQQQQGGPQPLPLMQARWGYGLAPQPLLLAAAALPLVSMPGLLLAAKELALGSVLPPPPLPSQLVWNTAADARSLVREGMAVPAAWSAAADDVKQEQQQAQGAARGGGGPATAAAAAAVPGAAAAARRAAAAAPPGGSSAGAVAAQVQAAAAEMQVQLLQRSCELPAFTIQVLGFLEKPLVQLEKQLTGGAHPQQVATSVLQQMFATVASVAAGAAASLQPGWGPQGLGGLQYASGPQAPHGPQYPSWPQGPSALQYHSGTQYPSGPQYWGEPPPRSILMDRSTGVSGLQYPNGQQGGGQ